MPYERSGGKQCIVYGCTNSQGKIYEWKNSECALHSIKQEDCPCLLPYKFHCLPSDGEKRREWLNRINRKDYNPSSKVLVCSVHFVDGRPTTNNPHPTLNMGYTVTQPTTPGRRPLVRKPLTPRPVKNLGEKENRIDTESNKVELDNPTEYVAKPLEYVPSEQPECDTFCCHLNTDLCKNFVGKCTFDVGTQTEDLIKMDHPYAYNYFTKSVGTQHTTPDFGADRIDTDSESKFYTGLTLTVFLRLIAVLHPFGKKLPYSLCVPDQVLLVLIRLRLGLTFHDLGRRFNVSRQLASAVFFSWLNIMAKHLSDCVMWLPRETIRRTMPASFKELYPKTTCIIDCSEIFIQRPFSMKARDQTYSTYKSHNTAKFLIAISPSGFIMFVSRLYGGRASDNFITKSSGFLEYLLPGDEVMADRGFTIGEELCARRVKLNIPAFMKGRKQLSEQDTIETRRIASQRIHVERAIMRMKTYRILGTTLQLKNVKNLDKILRIVAALCNLQDSLIRDKSAACLLE